MNWLTSRVATVAVPLALLALAGCDKGTDLDVDLPDTTGISTDYLDLDLGAQAATVRLQPVSTLKADHYLVGRLNEGVAGTTVARSYLNVLLPALPDSLPGKFTDPRLDSVVMVLTYDRVYGNGTAPVRLNIGNLPTRLDDRAVYDSSTPPSSTVVEWLGTNVPGKIDRTRQLTTSATTTNPAVTTTVPDPSVRLVLQRGAAGGPAIPSAFFEDLFVSLKGSGFTQAKLDEKLRGLSLEPANGYSGSILSLGRTAIGRIELFFHDQATPTKWRAFPLVFGPVYSASGQASALDPRYYTKLESDFSASALSPLALPNNVGVPATSLNNTSYLQEGNGLGTRISLSNLSGVEALRNLRGLAINRAELRVPIKPYSNLLFPNPPLLYVLEANDSSKVLPRVVNYVSYDRAVQTDGANPRSINNETVGTIVNSGTAQPYYSILLTTYLQAYLNNNLDGEQPASLILMPSIRRSPTLSLNRAAIDAGNIHLFVYYSQQ